jgi:hypothetical protein
VVGPTAEPSGKSDRARVHGEDADQRAAREPGALHGLRLIGYEVVAQEQVMLTMAAIGRVHMPATVREREVSVRAILRAVRHLHKVLHMAHADLRWPNFVWDGGRTGA